MPRRLPPPPPPSELTSFGDFLIRRVWVNDEWLYSMVDCMTPLSGSPNPRRYWSDMKKRMLREEGVDVYAVGVHVVPIVDSAGRQQKTDCANTETLLRIVQSVRSPNAEPFKIWLAKVGAQTLQDQAQMRAGYRRDLHQFDQALIGLVAYRGIVTPEQRERLRNANFAGLYDTGGAEQVARMRRLGFGIAPEDVMGNAEMGIHIFQRTQAALYIEQHDIRGEQPIIFAAEDTGVGIRMYLIDHDGILPENLPVEKRLSRGNYLTDEEIWALQRQNGEFSASAPWEEDVLAEEDESSLPRILFIREPQDAS